MIIPDKTAVIQFLLFVVFLIAFRFLVFRPFLEVLERREEKIEGTKRKASELLARFESEQSQYEAELAVARAAAQTRREAGREKGQTERETLLSRVRTEVEGIIERARGALSRETDEVRRELSSQGPELSLEVARKIIGRDLR